MATFSRPAVEIKQGNLTLYLTYVTPNDLLSKGFYTVDKLEPRKREGYQRILNQRRARRLSKHLVEAKPKGYAHLPTTVFLATDGSVRFDRDTQTLEFDTDMVCPFSVVDGQHRIEGLRLAVENDEELADFHLPVTIAAELDDTNQMYHFFIVNTTQEPVDKSLRQQITRRFTDMQGVDDMPYTPHWIEKEVSQGKDANALRMLEFLNEDVDSPLYGRIQMANDPIGRNKIRQAGIVTILRSEVFTASNPLAIQESNPERQARIMLNYFRAVDDLFVDGRDRDRTVVYKSNGIYFFLGVSKWVFGAIYSTTRDFTVSSIKKIITAVLDELEDEYQDVAQPDWWMSGPYGASHLNRSRAGQYRDAFQRAISRSLSSDVRL